MGHLVSHLLCLRPNEPRPLSNASWRCSTSTSRHETFIDGVKRTNEPFFHVPWPRPTWSFAYSRSCSTSALALTFITSTGCRLLSSSCNDAEHINFGRRSVPLLASLVLIFRPWPSLCSSISTLTSVMMTLADIVHKRVRAEENDAILEVINEPNVLRLQRSSTPPKPSIAANSGVRNCRTLGKSLLGTHAVILWSKLISATESAILVSGHGRYSARFDVLALSHRLALLQC